VLLLFGKHAKPWLSVLFRQIGIGVAFWVLLSVLIPWMFLADIELRGVGMDGSGRMRLWSEAWAMSLVNFPFGMGPQSWLTHEVITPAYETGKRLGHPHNMYLMWAAEYGWLAVFGLILIGVEGVRRVWNVRREIALFSLQFEQTQLMIALVASVIAAFFMPVLPRFSGAGIYACRARGAGSFGQLSVIHSLVLALVAPGFRPLNVGACSCCFNGFYVAFILES